MAGYMNNMESIDKIASGTWKDVRLLEMLNKRLRSPITRRDFLRRAAVVAATGIAAPYLISKSRADEPPQTEGIT